MANWAEIKKFAEKHIVERAVKFGLRFSYVPKHEAEARDDFYREAQIRKTLKRKAQAEARLAALKAVEK